VARADEVIYSAGLPGAPRVILWVKFSACRGVFFLFFFPPHRPKTRLFQGNHNDFVLVLSDIWSI
jgi:hypothetical protein